MKFRHCLFFGFFFCLLPALQAQVNQVQHQVFSVDQILEVRLDLRDDYSVETWQGSNILAEIQITLDHARKELLEAFVKEGRYSLSGSKEGDTVFHISSGEKARKNLRTKSGSIEESVFIKVYVPADFTLSEDRKTLSRPRDSNSSVINGSGN